MEDKCGFSGKGKQNLDSKTTRDIDKGEGPKNGKTKLLLWQKRSQCQPGSKERGGGG